MDHNQGVVFFLFLLSDVLTRGLHRECKSVIPIFPSKLYWIWWRLGTAMGNDTWEWEEIGLTIATKFQHTRVLCNPATATLSERVFVRLKES